MKHNKKITIALLGVLVCAMLFTGCGMNNAAEDNTGDGGNQSNQSTELSPGKFGTMDEGPGTNENGNDNAGAQMNEAAGDNQNGTDNNTDNNNTGNNNGKNSGNGGNNIVNDTEDAVDDVADGVGDAIDNLGGGSFDSYEESRDYLLNKLKEDNKKASYEIREENKELISYNSNDSGAQGYQFSVYETDKNEKIGIYYVDKENGKIYRYMGKQSIEAY